MNHAHQLWHWLPNYFHRHLLLTENLKLEMSFKTFGMVKKNNILVTFSFIPKYNHDKGEFAQVPSSAGMFYAFHRPSSISAAWFDRQPLKRWTSRGRYLNKRSPGNSLPENSTRVCWTLEKPIFGSESESVHLSAVSVRLYFKNMTEHTHTHTHSPWLKKPHSFGHQEWTVWKRSQCAEFWPFQTWKEFPFFSLQKNRLSQWEVRSFWSYAAPVPDKYIDSYFTGGGEKLKTKREKWVDVLQKERTCPRMLLLTIKCKIQTIL